MLTYLEWHQPHSEASKTFWQLQLPLTEVQYDNAVPGLTDEAQTRSGFNASQSQISFCPDKEATISF